MLIGHKIPSESDKIRTIFNFSAAPAESLQIVLRMLPLVGGVVYPQRLRSESSESSDLH
jgi:hypothetical protein